MRAPRPMERDPAAPRLYRRRAGERVELWTETVGRLPAVYGEGWTERVGRAFRRFEPPASKLAAGIAAGWSGPLPGPGERWLYLGAASGSTASHVADLVGPEGSVYAVEKSPRPFARLLDVSRRWPNLLPILADARRPDEYADLVPPVDGVYADVAQPDQVDLIERNLALLAGTVFRAVIALKTASMGRSVSRSGHRTGAEASLGRLLDLVPSVRLDPLHRGHYLVGGTSRGGAARDPRRLTRPRGRPPGRP